MERRILRLEIGVLLILVLNILILSVQISQKHVKKEVKEIAATKELPIEFNDNVQKKLLLRITETYNANDYVGMYGIFSEWAQLQITKETIENEFKKLTKMSGKIVNTVYSNYDYIGFESGADWYYVYYKTKFENAIGTTKIKLRVVGANWELVGINMNIDEI